MSLAKEPTFKSISRGSARYVKVEGRPGELSSKPFKKCCVLGSVVLGAEVGKFSKHPQDIRFLIDHQREGVGILHHVPWLASCDRCRVACQVRGENALGRRC